MASQYPPGFSRGGEEEFSVYLAFKDIFMNNNATIRRDRKIRELIRENELRPPIAKLMEQYPFESIETVVKILLKSKVFESVRDAAIHFPTYFKITVTPKKNTKRMMSGAEAANDQVDANKDIVKKEAGEQSMSKHR